MTRARSEKQGPRYDTNKGGKGMHKQMSGSADINLSSLSRDNINTTLAACLDYEDS